jgi:hypothetical protein
MVVIVTDNPIYAEGISDAIQRQNIHIIPSESSLYNHMPDFGKNPPAAFILTTNIRWCNPVEDIPMPEEVLNQGAYLAGKRMYEKLRTLLPTPVIVITTMRIAAPESDNDINLQVIDFMGDVRKKISQALESLIP